MTFKIDEITLYKSGVGFFTGKCKEKSFTLPINENDVNDVLKSLSVDDLKSVTFSAAEEKDYIKKKIGININSDSAFLGFSQHLIGLKVDIESDINYKGIILGTDFLLTNRNENEEEGIDVLIIQDKKTIHHIPISKIKKMTILDGTIIKDLDAFLQLEAATRKLGVINLQITSEKENAALHFVAPVSAWRLSYRVQFNEEAGTTDFTGIAIVDNTTSIDWEKIILKLVTGQPVSFRYNLLSPLIVDRPWIPRDEQGISPILAQSSFAMKQPPKPSTGYGRFRRDESSDGISVEGKTGWDVSREIIRSKVSAPTEELGSIITYKILNPVTINRSESSLIPLFNHTQNGELNVVIREDRLDEAMDALFFKENIQLEKGVATIYIDDIFAGDAIVVRGTDYLAFRVNQDVKAIKTMIMENKITNISIKNKILYQQYTGILHVKFNFLNIADKKMPIVLELVKPESSYEPKQKPVKETSNYIRYKLDLEPGSTEKEFEFTKTYTTSIYIRDFSEETFNQYLKDGLIDKKDEKQILEIFTYLAKIREKEELLQEIDEQINWEYRNQERIRENIKMLQEIKDTITKTKYLEQLKTSEQFLEKLNHEKKDLKDEIQKLNKEI